TLPEADMVPIAIVGTGGLRPALAAIEAGKDIAVTSKEILVMAGEIVMEAARKKGVNVLPVDSEHNAIFQCLEKHRTSKFKPQTSELKTSMFSVGCSMFDVSEIQPLILTASGGPFRKTPREKLA